MQVEIGTLYSDTDDDGNVVDHLVYMWAPATPARAEANPVMSERDVVILGAGMHPWGKWGRDFTEYGMVAARAALADAGLAWTDIQYVAGAETIRNGYPGFVPGSTFSQKLGWIGVPVSSSYAACASGSTALQAARANILAGFCDVALVIGADTTPKGFFAPVGGDRPDDPDWLRFHLLGATNPVFFALNARRRMDVYGATAEDFAQVKVKNSRHGLENPNARFRKENTRRRRGEEPDRQRPAAPARHLRDERRRRGADRDQRRVRRTQARHARRCAPRQGRVAEHADLPAGPPRAARLRHGLVGRRHPAGARLQGLDHLERVRRGRTRPRRRRPSPRCTTCPPRSSSTGTRTSACAPRARPSSCCARARRRSAAESRSTRRAAWPASARRSRPRRSPRCASSRGSSAGRPPAARSRVPGRHHRQPGPVRPRLVRHRQHLSEGDTMPEAFIVDAVRTPVGRRGGGLSTVHPADLGAHSIKALIERTGDRPRRRRRRRVRQRRLDRPAGR